MFGRARRERGRRRRGARQPRRRHAARRFLRGLRPLGVAHALRRLRERPPPHQGARRAAAQGEHVGGRRALRGRLRAVLAGQGALSLLVAPLAVDRLDLHPGLLQLAGLRLHRHPRPSRRLDDRRLRLPHPAHPHRGFVRHAAVSRVRGAAAVRLGRLGRPRPLPASLLPRRDVRRRAAHLAAGAAPGPAPAAAGRASAAAARDRRRGGRGHPRRPPPGRRPARDGRRDRQARRAGQGGAASAAPPTRSSTSWRPSRARSTRRAAS